MKQINGGDAGRTVHSARHHIRLLPCYIQSRDNGRRQSHSKTIENLGIKQSPLNLFEPQEHR